MTKPKNEEINLDILPKEHERIFNELHNGKMIIARNNDDFLYIIDFNAEFHMFSHTIGAPGGGQRQFPKNDKYRAAVRKIVDLADALFSVEYNREMNVYGVMATAEDAVLTMFPGDERDKDGMVEFLPWDKEKSAKEAESAYDSDNVTDPFGSFNPLVE